MGKTQNNLHYFKISKDNQENYLMIFMFLTIKNIDLSKYIENTKEIKAILITIKTLQDKKKKNKR